MKAANTSAAVATIAPSRCVKWIATRSEDMVSLVQGRDFVMTAKLGVKDSTDAKRVGGRIGAGEERRVRRHAKALRTRQLDGGNRLVEDTFLADRFVVTMPVE